jgi:hypothetical protein
MGNSLGSAETIAKSFAVKLSLTAKKQGYAVDAFLAIKKNVLVNTSIWGTKDCAIERFA